jgi:phosphoglycerol transferase MdoB-like AlkP superfamily enzyme
MPTFETLTSTEKPMNLIRRLPFSVRYIFMVYLTGILFFTCFRLVLLFTNVQAAGALPGSFVLLAKALFMGFRFDTVVSGYFLAVPFTVLIIAELWGKLNPRLLKILSVFTSVLYGIAFFICAADIPFFNNFSTRLNITVLNWTNSPLFMIKLVVQEWSYLVYFFLFLGLLTCYRFLIRRNKRRFIEELEATYYVFNRKQFFFKLEFCLLGALLMFIGIRGRIAQKSPIQVGTAYFSNYSFPNQLGLNPVFTFLRSYIESKKERNKTLHFMDDQLAIQQVQKYLGITGTSGKEANPDFPVARVVRKKDTLVPKYNVVLVIMESMSANYMQRFGEEKKLTPFLDSLARNGYSFDNFYSAGIHTFNGIYSSLYSFPALMAKHTMENTIIPEFTGLPFTLKENGYNTVYFTTHDDQFDNVAGFLSANSFNRIVSQKDYPSSEVVSTLGVPDHFMFDYSIPLLNEMEKGDKPFFAAYMTATNHGPFLVPENIPFKAHYKGEREPCVEYSDWAIGQFMKKASTQRWFRNTIFVFVADHGAPHERNVYDMPLSYNHIPLIMYAPSILKEKKVVNGPGGQIDIYPTLCGILNLDYVNNTLGQDLLKEKRPYMFFSADDKIGVIDSSDFYIWYTDGRENIYDFRSSSTLDLLKVKRRKADSMKTYAQSMLQATQWMIDNKKTGSPVHK